MLTVPAPLRLQAMTMTMTMTMGNPQPSVSVLLLGQFWSITDTGATAASSSNKLVYKQASGLDYWLLNTNARLSGCAQS